MTHILPPHTELSLAQPSLLDPAMHIDQDEMETPQTPSQAAPAMNGSASGKKRKKTSGEDGERARPAEPRRLRRSHEACARCRSKKIKCDSKHPRCTACASAGTVCHQEDRHRQTLTPRGHTERIERQLLQCEALLKRHIPNFVLENLEDICATQGIDVDVNPSQISDTFQFAPSPSAPRPPFSAPGDGSPTQTTSPVSAAHKGLSYGAGQGANPVSPQAYPPMAPVPYAPPAGSFNGQYPSGYAAQPALSSLPRPTSSGNNDIKGQDPQNYDMSNTQALAKSFGVSAAIVNDIKLVAPDQGDKEDLAVGSGGLSSGRDRDIAESSVPRDVAKWILISMHRRASVVSPTAGHQLPPGHSVSVWLPKDRAMVRRMLKIYFSRLNYHRPVFFEQEFMQTLDALYEGQNVQHDPGYICSFYLMLALATLSDMNHIATARDSEPGGGESTPTNIKILASEDWPDHEEFFERALAVKPDLRVTVSSLQALVLLQWYLYTERQGRSLWRLVGSLVRLGIELGLHHDPTVQQETFSEAECQLRIRLWGIVMMHDRGTSILLGRPLAIAPSDSNTPRPTYIKKGQLTPFSEHFLFTHPIAEIQADIINSLYTPTRQSADSIMRHATRIIKSMVEFRKQLPERYKWYFSGTDEWPLERRNKLVQDINEDQGLTMLKIGITRILLLRALFSSKELGYPQRRQALIDAVVTSHNIIIIHNQLIRFPDIAFFVSPIPLHIAAMVILYGHMSRCNRLTRQVALEDVWMALDMLPRFRWRWERKDLNGAHPLISKVAERVLEVNLHQVGPPSHPVLLSEEDWEAATSGMASPMSPTGQHPGIGPVTANNAQTAHQGVPYGPGPAPGGGPYPQHGPRAVQDQKLIEVDTSLFYPFFPEKDQPQAVTLPRNGNMDNMNTQDIGRLLAHHIEAYGYQQSHESFMLEEKDLSAAGPPTVWMNAQPERKYEQRQMPGYGMHS